MSPKEYDAMMFDGLADSDRDMSTEPPQVQLENRLDAIVRELDDILATALDDDKWHLIEPHEILVGQLIRRAQQLGSPFIERKRRDMHPKFRAYPEAPLPPSNVTQIGGFRR